MHPFLLAFVPEIDLVKGEVFVGLCVWVTNHHIKKGRALPLPEATALNIYPSIWGSIRTLCQRLSRDLLGYRFYCTCTPWQTMFSILASRSCRILCLWMINPPRLHTMAWSTVKLPPLTQVEDVSATCQSYQTCIASLNSLLFWVKFDRNYCQPAERTLLWSKFSDSLGVIRKIVLNFFYLGSQTGIRFILSVCGYIGTVLLLHHHLKAPVSTRGSVVAIAATYSWAAV